MGYSQIKKENKKKQIHNSPITGLREQWLDKRPVIFFVLGFMGLMIFFNIFWLSEFGQQKIQPAFISLNASLSGFILNLLGQKTITSGDLITSSCFSVRIARGCDGVEAMILFSSTLLAFPAKWNYKLAGFLAGMAVLFALNIVRIVSLFFTGIYFPRIFEFMHVEFWQVLFILIAIGLWIFWIRWARKGESHVSK